LGQTRPYIFRNCVCKFAKPRRLAYHSRSDPSICGGKNHPSLPRHSPKHLLAETRHPRQIPGSIARQFTGSFPISYSTTGIYQIPLCKFHEKPLGLFSDTEFKLDQLADNTKIGLESTYEIDPQTSMFERHTQPPSLIVNNGGFDIMNLRSLIPVIHYAIHIDRRVPRILTSDQPIAFEKGLVVKTMGRTWKFCSLESSAIASVFRNALFVNSIWSR